MIRRVRLLLQGLAALTIAVAIVVGIPATLIEAVGWPLPTAWPTIDQLRQFTQVGVSDDTIVKTLAVIVWITWAQIAVAIVVETAAIVRRRTAATLKLLPGVQPLAARLVATIALIAAASTVSRTAALAMAPLHTAVAGPATVPADIDVPDTPTARPASETPATRTVTTTGRDSWWRLAEIHLGDGLRWRELRQLNLGRTVAPGVVIQTDTDQLDNGWQLRVPVTDGEPTAPPDEDQGTPAVPVDWQVERGDHFWHIAEQTLTDAWGRAPTDAEITPYWRALVEHNRHRLAPPRDENLIYPGQTFELPAPPADPTEPAAAEQPAAEDPERPTPDRDAPPPLAETDTPHSSAFGDGHDVAPDGWQTAIERGNSAEPDATVTSDPPETAVPGDNEDERNALGVPVGLAPGIAATSLLAAGVAALMRWRRRKALRERPEGYRLPTPLPATESMVARLETAAMPERILDDLAALLCSIPSDTHPALVTTVDDGTVTLLFDDTMDVPEPSTPWRLADDGTDGPVGWVARLGERGPDRSIGLPLLITLGRTGQTTVLANVAALPQLAVDGDERDVTRLLRTMSLEAATSRIAVPVEAVVVGDHRMETLDNLRHVADPTPEIDAAMAEIEQGVIPDDRTPRLLVCHPGSPDCDVPAELLGTVGVLSPATDTPSRWTLRVDSHETGALILPDAGTVELALPTVDPEDIDQELRRLEQPPEPANAVATVASAGEEGMLTVELSPNGQIPAENSEARTAHDGGTEPAWCEVRLLGPVEVHRNGQRIEGIPPRSLEILIYLVTHADGVSKERIDDAVWGGQAGKPGTQRLTAAMTKLRDALGDGPDGEPLVPRRTRADRIQLSNHVASDLDRAFAHLALARDLPAELRATELAAALDLVRGEFLEDLPLSWASEITQRVIAELQDAALELGRIHREAKDYDAAEHALRQGLQLLDSADALYLELAEIEHTRGRPDRVSALWRELRQRHAADADEVAGLIDGPLPEIELAFRDLLSTV